LLALGVEEFHRSLNLAASIGLCFSVDMAVTKICWPTCGWIIAISSGGDDIVVLLEEVWSA